MAVYVDDMKAELGRMKMCHMIADSSEELLQMVDQIGVQRRWIQHAGTYREHFDISLSKRALAVKNGAVKITWDDLGRKVAARKPTVETYPCGCQGTPGQRCPYCCGP